MDTFIGSPLNYSIFGGEFYIQLSFSDISKVNEVQKGNILG